MQHPRVVAHRGASAEVAEHTLEAYVEALDVGADAVECDVRLTADGHLVCVHDRDLRRTAGRHGLISTMELAELDELDFSAWKHPWSDFDDEAPEREPSRLLTLQLLLETIRDYDRTVELAVETKHPTRYAGLVERRLVELLDRFGWGGAGSPVRVMSFSSIALGRVARLAPDLDLVMLLDSSVDWLRTRPLAAPGWIAGPGIEVVRRRPELVRRLRRRGTRVHCWVVNDQADLDLCLELGIEAVITDRPGWLRGRLDAQG